MHIPYKLLFDVKKPAEARNLKREQIVTNSDGTNLHRYEMFHETGTNSKRADLGAL